MKDKQFPITKRWECETLTLQINNFSYSIKKALQSLVIKEQLTQQDKDITNLMVNGIRKFYDDFVKDSSFKEEYFTRAIQQAANLLK